MTLPTLTFYDIAFRPPVTKTTCAPNPWKSRYALNFKNLPYKTTWVQQPDIASVRRALHAPATRKFADGSDFYTLPVLTLPDPSSPPLGDSFDIAVHLQTHYPTSGHSPNTDDNNLFPADTQGLDYTYTPQNAFYAPLSERHETDATLARYAHFNTHVDAAFSAHAQLMVLGMPLDPATAEAVKKEFVRRAGVSDWEVLGVRGEARRAMMESLRGALEGLAAVWEVNKGPFLRGQQACYADFVVGGWLRMCRGCLEGEEWEEVKGWFGGVFGRLDEALEVYAKVE